eukprot:TRINITY_DN1055_c0_g1_i1.p3 TRINITY_DN1055_c0_g1~~TRINITY_DN1055_c0_g1_i1.p3  ORF type:complete len:118 (-),score=27.14 TRINITY_DN1055_c0_g1_i1:85-438(-)
MMIFTQWFVFLGFVSHFFHVPIHEPSFAAKLGRLEGFHLTPVILYGGFTVFLIINPLNKALGAVTCWVMGMPVLFALYQWYSFQQQAKRKRAKEVAKAAIQGEADGPVVAAKTKKLA